MTQANTMPTTNRRCATALLTAGLLALAGLTAPANAQKAVQPNAGAAGQWKLIGQTHANHAPITTPSSCRGRSTISAASRSKVSVAPLNALHWVVTHDNALRGTLYIWRILPGGKNRGSI